jgi:hypothetical protein
LGVAVPMAVFFQSSFRNRKSRKSAILDNGDVLV